MNKKNPNDTLWWVLGITGGLFTLGTAIIIHQQKIKAKAKKWLQPVTARISSPFGHRTHPVTGEQRLHNGIDLAVPVGTQVRCPMDGSVSNVFYSKEGGNQIYHQAQQRFSNRVCTLKQGAGKKRRKDKTRKRDCPFGKYRKKYRPTCASHLA
jgi:hypothetical protein